jgi:hypothetical protein
VSEEDVFVEPFLHLSTVEIVVLRKNQFRRVEISAAHLAARARGRSVRRAALAGGGLSIERGAGTR